jgi:purine-binding chemotaxis protein CheW
MAEASGDLSDIKEDATVEKYLVFSIKGKLYAFPSKFIGEIAVFDAVYGLPLMPRYIPGVVNRYSVPYALLDTSLLFFNTAGRRNKILVLKDDIDRVALLVDKVSDIADVREDALAVPEKSEFATASFNFEGNNVLVLDIHKIIKRVTEETVLPEVNYD